MPIYMKFPGINGPITYDNSKGWIELGSVSFGTGREIGNPTGTSSNRESGAVHVQEVNVTKSFDSTSQSLFNEALSGTGKNVTIVFVQNGQEYLRLNLEGALISSYSMGGGGGERPMESFSLNFTKMTFKMGSPAHASLMIRPQDWGSLKAMEEFNRTRQA